MKWAILAAGIVSVAALLAVRAGREEARPAKKAAAVPTAAVAKAEREDLTRQIVLTAEFRPRQEIDVMAKVAGYVKRIYVDVGDRVQTGQVLAELEIPEMMDDRSRADASVKRYQADVERARDELRRAQSAHEMAHLSYSRLAEVMKTRPGLIAQQEVDDARSRDLVSEAQVSAAKSAQASAEEQVRVAQAERTKVGTLMAYTRVTAPFAGVVTRRFADTGSMIQAGTASQTQAMPVVRLSENRLLRLTIPVPESAVPKVRVGAEVNVRVPSLDREFRGRIARTADKLDLATRTMHAEVDVPNPKMELVPGMYAEVRLGVDSRKGAVVVPLTALNGSGESATVYLVDSDGKIGRRSVSVGLRTADRAEIRGGIQPGDLVVVAGRDRLNPGQQVTPRLITEAVHGL